MTRIPSTTAAIALGLAALLSVAAAGCSNMKKSSLESTAATISPPVTPAAVDEPTLFREAERDPVPVDLSAADVDPETRPEATTDETPEAAAEPVSIVVSDKTDLPRTVTHVKESTFDAEVLQSDVPVLVDFYSPTCGPCLAMHPVLERLARRKAGDLTVVRLNVDEHPEAAARFGIQGVPTFIIFNRGAERGRMSGAMPETDLSLWVASRT